MSRSLSAVAKIAAARMEKSSKIKDGEIREQGKRAKERTRLTEGVADSGSTNASVERGRPR
jgi:hypothetical protein